MSIGNSGRAPRLATSTLLGLLVSTAGCVPGRAAACPVARPVADLYATYDIVSVEKYRGGLTSQVQAEALVGREVEISFGIFRMGEVTIEQPRYEIHCHPVPTEGEVTTDRWSNFYGLQTGRNYVEVLDVFSGNETRPDFRLEVIGHQELWRLYDGWLYRIHAGVPE